MFFKSKNKQKDCTNALVKVNRTLDVCMENTSPNQEKIYQIIPSQGIYHSYSQPLKKKPTKGVFKLAHPLLSGEDFPIESTLIQYALTHDCLVLFENIPI